MFTKYLKILRIKCFQSTRCLITNPNVYVDSIKYTSKEHRCKTLKTLLKLTGPISVYTLRNWSLLVLLWTSSAGRMGETVHHEELISSRTVADKFGGEDGRDGTPWGTDLFSHCCWQVRRGGWERRYTMRNWSLLALLLTSSAGRMGETVHHEELISSRTVADKFGGEDGRDGKHVYKTIRWRI